MLAEGVIELTWLDSSDAPIFDECAFPLVIHPVMECVYLRLCFADDALVIQYGYVTFFAMACPLVSLLAAINNLISIRAQSVSLCQAYQRPSLELAGGIGSWGYVLQLMVYASVVTNCALVFFAMESVKAWFPDLLLRTVLFFATEHVVIALGKALDSIVPMTPLHIRDEHAREMHQKMMKQQDERLGMHTLDPSSVELCDQPWHASSDVAQRQSHV